LSALHVWPIFIFFFFCGNDFALTLYSRSGIYLRDIIYIETGTPAEQEASEQKGVIQFRQKKKVFAIIHFLQNYQSIPYDFVVYDDLLEFVQNLPALSETALYELSIKREPKGAKRSSLL